MSLLYQDLNYTQFPEKLDTFKQWLDITASDGPLVREYMEAVKNGDIALAEEKLAQIPEGYRKIVKAIDLNKLSQAIQALERFYKSDVKDYIEQKQFEWEYIIGQFRYLGRWNNGYTYSKANMVSYVVRGEDLIYLAIDEAPANVPPTDKRYWRQITVKGQQGTSGEGVAYRYQWESATQYSVDDVVTYDGALWIAKIPSQGKAPAQGSDAWSLIMILSATTYPIQDEEPRNQVAGDLWFNTSPNPTEFYFLEPLRNPAGPDDIAKGKEAYNDKGERIVGSSTGVASDVQWNQEVSPISWNN